MNIQIGKYRKLIAYGASVALTYLTQKYSGDPSATTWLPLVVAVAGAYGVYAAPNDSPMLEVAGEVAQTFQHSGAAPVPTTVPTKQNAVTPHAPGAPLSTPLSVMEATTGPRTPGSPTTAAGSAPVE